MAPIDLRCDQLDAIPSLGQNVLRIHGTISELTQERVERLAKWGFVRGTENVCQLLDISGFDTRESFVKTLPPKRRSLMRQVLRLFQESGCTMEISPLRDVEDNDISAFYTDVVIPACSFRSISPYNVLHASSYHAFLGKMDKTSTKYFLQMKLQGKVVAGGIANVTTISGWIEKCCKESPDASAIWERPLLNNATVFDLKLAHSHPTAGGAKLSPHMSRLLYWYALVWAIENRIEYFSGGAEDRQYLPEDYLGVIYFKKLWGMSSAVIFRSQNPVYLLIPEELYLGTKRNALIPYFAENGKVRFRYLLSTGVEDDQTHALLAGDTHFEKEIVAANKQDEDEVRRFLREKRIDADVRRFEWGK